MKFLIATDSFKDSLNAYNVGVAIKKGIHKAKPGAEVVISPMADGGEGTIDVLLKSGRKDARKIEVEVHDPLMKIVKASYMVLGNTAYIECAQSTGLMLLEKEERNPMIANSYGLGEQIKDAVKHGIRDIVISLGGSATNDAGLGMLQALGWDFYSADGKKVGKEGNPLLIADSLSDENVLPELKDCQFTIASDVMNPFYGENGAAYIFARQKGASDEDIKVLDTRLQIVATMFEKQYGIQVQQIGGAGAAGGLGGGILACLAGKMTPGVEAIMQITGLHEKIKQADVIFTGEGSLDHQSLMGKVPIGVAKAAKLQGKRVIGIAGRIDTELGELNNYLDAVFSIQTECRSLEEALKPEITATQLEVTAEQIARLL